MTTWRKIKANPDLINRYLVREKVIDTIRAFFKDQGFHEVQTPILVPVPSAEPNLEVFETRLQTAKGKTRRSFLILSPEYSLKKLIAAGLGNIFEITKCFRNNEEISAWHNPEFTMLEWYRVEADYKKIMEDFENLFLAIIGKNTLIYQKQKYDLTPPWPRISFTDAFAKYANKELTEVKDEDFYRIFLNDIEPQLRTSHKPVFVYDYPISQAALAKKKKANPSLAERWEVFLAGIELGNCFSELTDAKEQHQRLKADLSQRKKTGKTPYPMDTDFIAALQSGMPETAGIAVGVDRLVMLAADVPDISQTLFFPGQELFDL